MEEDRFLTLVEKTALCEQLKKMRDLYADLQQKQDSFCEHFCVHCKSGCGSCCEHFVPDITTAEAEFLAFGVIVQDRVEQLFEILDRWDLNSGFCPLYDWNNPEHHCTVYRWRPMICRLFGAAASEDKNGHPVFGHCKWNEQGHYPSTKEMEESGESLVLMGKYGRAIEEETLCGSDTELLPKALKRALAKVQLMLQLEEEANQAGEVLH